MAHETIQLSLKEFIKSTLVDINEAVIEAVQEGIPIAYAQYTTGQHPMMKSVEFDIAVQVTESNVSGKNSEGGWVYRLLILNLAKKATILFSMKILIE
jgi:NMD protein affecting ribosome stability and mRNA decay